MKRSPTLCWATRPCRQYSRVAGVIRRARKAKQSAELLGSGRYQMSHNLLSVEIVDKLEESVSQPALARLADHLAYFKFIQETLLVAFKNGDVPLQTSNVSVNPKPFVYISTTRAFSISKIAMEITIRGYPQEGMALTRTLFELFHSTQYLARHPNLINDYLLGTLKLEKILKMAKMEDPEIDMSSFGRFWGLMSRYSHASPDLLALTLTAKEGNKVEASLVVSDPKRIDDTVYGIMSALFMQYLFFRFTLKNDFSVTPQLRERDRYIFDPANIRRFTGLSSFSNEELAQIYPFIASEANH